jgi:hypothetical protein
MTEHLYKNHIIEKRKYGYNLYNMQRQIAWDVQYHKHPSYELGVIANPVLLPRKLGEIKQYIDGGLALEDGHLLVYAADQAEAVDTIRRTIPVVEATETHCYQWIAPSPPATITRFARLQKTLGDVYELNKEYFGSYYYWAGYDQDGQEVWSESCPYGYGQPFHYSYQGRLREIVIAHIEVVRELDHWFWKLSCEGEKCSAVSS